MLITKCVDLQINGRNKERLKNLGYLIPTEKDSRGRARTPKGSYVTIKATDLSIGSHASVEVACDYCGEVSVICYKDYLKAHDEKLGDCCRKCENVKYRATMQEKYGVDNSAQLSWVKEKAIQTNREKYGYDWHMLRPEYQHQLEETIAEKYGVVRPLQYPDFLAKCLNTRAKNGNFPTSKPQKELGELLKNIYGNCQLEVPCDRCSIDCLVEVDGNKIDVEYDGWYWHQDKNRDIRRDNFMKKNGYKVLRVKGNKKEDMPTVKQIKNSIDKLLNGYNYVEIVM